jgi:hypothetical protein
MMAVLDQGVHPSQRPLAVSPAIKELDELAARRSLRRQIARLERELAQAFVTAYRMGGIDAPAEHQAQPRLLDLGALERVRDELAERVHAARSTISARADAQAANRVLLEQMLLEPHKHRFTRIAARDLGEPGCGVWQVRPRLGLIGMLMNWWEVKLSSGCPLGQGRGHVPAARNLETTSPESTSARTTALQRSGYGPRAGSILSAMRGVLRTGAGGVLVMLIMVLGSFVLWIGTPLLWLWIGSQVQGATQSLGSALAVALIGAVLTVVLLAYVLAKLSDVYRSNRAARGLHDTGHVVLEGVLVVSAGVTVAAFVVWFFLLSGANPVPLDLNL